jgi:hypothetical protein
MTCISCFDKKYKMAFTARTFLSGTKKKGGSLSPRLILKYCYNVVLNRIEAVVFFQTTVLQR